MRFVRSGMLGGILALLASAIPAHAQQSTFSDIRACEGEISSLALAAIPAGDSYAVDIFDPTELALSFRRIFLAELQAAEKQTDENGNLVFSFRAESIFRGVTSRNQVSPTYRGDDGASRGAPRTAEDETRDLIRSDHRGQRDDTRTSQQVIVEAELRNRETQRVLWLATIRCDPLTNDQNVLMRFVAEIFVENLGDAVKQKAL